MSTTPTEAQIKLAYEIIFASEDGSASPMEAARLIRDSEARAVEAETALLRKLYASEKLAKVERGDMFCACQDALTAERERVRVLREALEFLLIGYEGHYETGKCDTNCAVQARAALAANSEHAKEGSK